MSSQSTLGERIIQAITAPLGFFVLALLIVESFLGVVLVGANLERQDKITGMWLGVGLFVLVVVVVFILVWFKPENLTFDKDAHLVNKGKAPFGSDRKIVMDIDALLPSESNSSRKS